MTAPPRPCTARAAMSVAGSCASPPASEASPNSVRPAQKTSRRPNRSAARPPSSRNPAQLSVYALTTHCSPAVEKPRSARIAPARR